MTYQKILRKKIQIMPTNKSMKEETLEAMHIASRVSSFS